MRILSVTAVFLCVFSSAAMGDFLPGTYRFADHPDGALSSFGPYGLRLDDLLRPTERSGALVRPETDETGATFSTERGAAEVKLVWDGGDSATISGTLFNNGSGELWTVEHVLSDITVTDGGFVANAGTMSLRSDSANVVYASASNGQGVFMLTSDSFRCNGREDCGPVVGAGWLSPIGGKIKGQFNDWLVQVKPVPLPASFVLFLSALGVLMLRRRSAKANTKPLALA